MGVIIPSVAFARGGITMDFEWGQPGISTGHLLPPAQGPGDWKLFFKRFGRRAQFFSSLGPSRHLPHDHNDESANESNG